MQGSRWSWSTCCWPAPAATSTSSTPTAAGRCTRCGAPARPPAPAPTCLEAPPARRRRDRSFRLLCMMARRGLRCHACALRFVATTARAEDGASLTYRLSRAKAVVGWLVGCSAGGVAGAAPRAGEPGGAGGRGARRQRHRRAGLHGADAGGGARRRRHGAGARLRGACMAGRLHDGLAARLQGPRHKP